MLGANAGTGDQRSGAGETCGAATSNANAAARPYEEIGTELERSVAQTRQPPLNRGLLDGHVETIPNSRRLDGRASGLFRAPRLRTDAGR